MLKKIFHNRVLINSLVMFVYIFSLEMVIRYFTEVTMLDWGTLRIAISSAILAILISFIGHLLPKLGGRIFHIIVCLILGIYEFAQFGLYNYIGFFMGLGNGEQGTKVTAYIMDFLNSIKPIYWTILLPIVLVILYYFLVDRLIFKKWTRNKTLTMLQKGYLEVLTLIVICALCGFYYWTIRNPKMQNDLQTESNYSLWLYPENSNLTVNNFGVAMFGFIDIKSIILQTDNQIILEPGINNNQEDEPVTDYTRTIDDTAWQKLIANTKDKNFTTLNNYFINRDITSKNSHTGMFEGKNLIIIMMESVNEIAIYNKEDFPTLYKLYNEGISFRNNFTPRNNCSTGNNEFTVLSSLFTINNTCTANRYADNTYYEGAFNIFKNMGYKTSSYHDYTQKYYYRRRIHSGLGSEKFYSVTDLNIPYDDKYEEWPSDVDLFKQAKQYYMNEDKFMTYFATVSTHQTYHVPSELGDKYTYLWDDTDYSMRLKRYLSKMKTLDLALEELLNELESEGKLEDTVIALFGDHYPYGLNDSDINAYLKANNASYTINHNSTKEKNVDRTPMIIYNAGMKPEVVTDYTSVIDLLPTLLNMFNMDYDPRLYLGHDVFADDFTSRVVFSDGSWQNEYAFYYAPSSRITYFNDEYTYTKEELKSINQEISLRQKMSAQAIKTNYFKYLGEGLTKYQKQIDEEQNKTESEE